MPQPIEFGPFLPEGFFDAKKDKPTQKAVPKLNKLKDNANTIFDNVLDRCSKQLAVRQFKEYMDDIRIKLKRTRFNVDVLSHYNLDAPLNECGLLGMIWGHKEWAASCMEINAEFDEETLLDPEDIEWIFMNAYKLGVSMYASAQDEDQVAMKAFAKLVSSTTILTRDKLRVPVYFIYKFLEDILNGDISKRLTKDMQTSKTNNVLKTEFSQYKSILKVDNKGAFRLFERIREVDGTVTWDQIRDYFDSCRDLFHRVEMAIHDHRHSGDHDPNVDELRHVLNRDIYGGEIDKLGLQEVNWLFTMVSRQHGSKVTLIQLSDFMGEWMSIAQDIQERFRDQVRLRKKEETQNKKLQKIEDLVVENTEDFHDFIDSIRQENINQRHDGIQQMIIQTGNMSNAPSTTAVSMQQFHEN